MTTIEKTYKTLLECWLDKYGTRDQYDLFILSLVGGNEGIRLNADKTDIVRFRVVSKNGEKSGT